MTSQQPEQVGIESDPQSVAEEHHAEGTATPEDYEPEPEVVTATREADPADVAEQLDEVPGLAEDDDMDDDEPES